MMKDIIGQQLKEHILHLYFVKTAMPSLPTIYLFSICFFSLNYRIHVVLHFFLASKIKHWYYMWYINLIQDPDANYLQTYRNKHIAIADNIVHVRNYKHRYELNWQHNNTLTSADILWVTSSLCYTFFPAHHIVLVFL